VTTAQSAIIDIPACLENSIQHLAFSRESPCVRMTKPEIVFFSLATPGHSLAGTGPGSHCVETQPLSLASQGPLAGFAPSLPAARRSAPAPRAAALSPGSTLGARAGRRLWLPRLWPALPSLLERLAGRLEALPLPCYALPLLTSLLRWFFLWFTFVVCMVSNRAVWLWWGPSPLPVRLRWAWPWLDVRHKLQC